MPAKIIVGIQWGDEGKGKIIDVLAEKYDIVARYNGGPNAGHTVVVGDKKIILHHLPSGVLWPEIVNIIGNGMVIDPAALIKEIEELQKMGITLDPERLRISERAHIILPKYKDEEKSSSLSQAIQTTGRGIGPAYRAKAERSGKRMCDLVAGEIPEYQEMVDFLRPFVCDTGAYLNDCLEANQQILCEGAQGGLLDLDHGTYPWCTSSNSHPGNAAIGLGIGPLAMNEIIGVMKAYTTRVGGGPFPTEDFTPDGEKMLQAGQEFGATTGRPRRCGWLDLVALKYAIRTMGITALALTKLDVLRGFPKIKVCTKYVSASEAFTNSIPPRGLDKCAPVFESLDGFDDDISQVRYFEDLPKTVQKYIDFIERQLGVPAKWISVGPERNQVIV